MKKNKIFLFSIVLLNMILIFCGIKTAKASSKYISNIGTDNEITVSGVKFVAKQYKDGTEYKYKIIIIKNGKKVEIANNTTFTFSTNGKILYYVEQGNAINEWQHKNTIYQYTIKSGKTKKMISGTEYTILGCSGIYLYMGTDNGADGVDLYAFNINTKKKKHMTDVVGSLFISGNKVITSTNSGDAGNYPIHSFNLDGTGKKKILDGGLLSVKKGKIYYYRINKNGKFKVYKCSLKGKQKKALTGWVYTIDPDII